MSYELYKILHYSGMFILMMALGGIGTHVLTGGNRENFVARKWLASLHGMALVLLLISGAGLHLRVLPGEALQGWEIGKALIWLALGATPVLFYRSLKIAKITWWGVVALASTAALLALFKPF